MRNIILVGMPACGKSVLGVLLAKSMGKPFLDTDLRIQEREGLRLQEIIDRFGNPYFRQTEEAVLRGLQVTNTVIATGGSAIYYPKAMEHLGKTGTIVYIKVTLKTIEARLKNIKTRGVSMAPGETIKDIYQERIPLYESRSHVTVDGENRTVEETIEAIIETVSRVPWQTPK